MDLTPKFLTNVVTMPCVKVFKENIREKGEGIFFFFSHLSVIGCVMSRENPADTELRQALGEQMTKVLFLSLLSCP